MIEITGHQVMYFWIKILILEDIILEKNNTLPFCNYTTLFFNIITNKGI